MSAPRVPAHVLIPAIREAVKRGNLQRATIRKALKDAGVNVPESTLSSLLRLACAEGVLFRTGHARHTRYVLATWERRRDRKLKEQGPAPFLAMMDFEDL